MDNRKFGTIFNSDDSNVLYGAGVDWGAADYRHCVQCLLRTKPGVLAQNVGNPDPVIYRSDVATSFSKYWAEIRRWVWPQLSEEQARREALIYDNILAEGTDLLQLVIEASREAGVFIVASYRMNAEDFGWAQLDSYDFGRAHRHLSIPGAHCLDPAHAEVYMHRLDIFREVIDKYDIDGIELDFRRWNHMVSYPLHNHPVLTRMVQDVRCILDEAAQRKGRNRPILGARVAPMLEGPSRYEKPADNLSCRDIGLDVKTWIEKEYVDYICPALFNATFPGGLPKTAEFVELTRDSQCGVYPTIWPRASWMATGPDSGPVEADDPVRMRRYKDDLCRHALQCYEEGADGISTFNWVPHEQPGMMDVLEHRKVWGMGAKKIQMYIHPLLGDPAKVREYLEQEEVLPEEEGSVDKESR